MNNQESYFCDHIGLLTSNAERLIKFYRDVLKFKALSSERLKCDIVKQLFRINYDCCFYRLKSSGLVIEIFEPHKKDKRKNKNCYGIHHFGLKVQNREEFIHYLRKKKVKLITIKRNARKVYFFKDPDDNMIEIREEK